MKKVYFLFFILLFSMFYSQVVHIPDANFKAKLLEANTTNNIAQDLNGNPAKIDQNNDGEIQVSEAENISKISLNNRSISIIYYFFVWNAPEITKDIYSLQGINSFKNLKILDCSYAKLSTLDFTNLSHLTEIYCNNNQITAFTNFQYVKSLFALDCSSNQMTHLDLSNSSVINLQGGANEVLFNLNNNNFQYLNLQNNRRTAWVCLCSPSDLLCAFSGYPGYGIINTCSYFPHISGNPNLIEVKINCNEREVYGFDTAPNIIVDNCLAGTDDSVLKNRFKIYPNPATDFINIETKEKISEVYIVDYSGKLLLKPLNNYKRIATGQLPKGNYIQKIKSDKSEIDFKFIKN